MKQSLFLCTDKWFLGVDIVRRYTFKTITTRDTYALFQKQIVLNACHHNT